MKKFKVAFEGLFKGMKDKSILTQYILGIITLLFCLIIKLPLFYFIIILICIGNVIGFEYINTAIEKLSDLYTTEYNEKIKYIKDLSSAACLVQAFSALFIFLILLYYLFKGLI